MQLESMGFEPPLIVKALRRFPLPEQEVQRIEWILSGADGTTIAISAFQW
jgi:hypothetical protein